MQDVSYLVIKNLINNEEYCRKVLPFLKVEYFERKEKVLFKVLVKYLSKFNKLPNHTAFQYEFMDWNDEIFFAVTYIRTGGCCERDT